MSLFILIKNKMQDLGSIQVKQMHQQSQIKSNPPKSQSKQPFLISRPQYSELCLYQRNGHWSQKEKLKYVLFLEHFKERFLVKAKRRFNNIFDSMARFIKTRNSHQCRSHHQKMEKEKFQIEAIITSAKAKYNPDYYISMKERYLSEIQGLEIESNDDFNEFKQKIQKQQQKKDIQRQKVAQNKRILRSTKPRTSNHIKKKNKHHNMKNHLNSSQETHPKKVFIPAQMDGLRNEHQRIQEVSNQVSSSSSQMQENKASTPQIHSNQPIFNVSNNIFQSGVYIQPFQHAYNNYKIMWQLQIQLKRQTDLAYFHYNQYLTHTTNANNLQHQLMKMCQMMMNGNYGS